MLIRQFRFILALLVISLLGKFLFVDAQNLAYILQKQQQQLQGTSKCLYLCQNDHFCKTGQCILTECSDTVACYKYCMLCNSQLKCYQSGDFCDYNSSIRVNLAYSLKLLSFSLFLCRSLLLML